MSKRTHGSRWLAGFVVVQVIAAGCEGRTQPPASAPRAAPQPEIRFAVVTHGQSSDPFWSVVKRGVDDAARHLGVVADYQAPSTFDMVAMGRLIEAAVASKVDGLVVSLPDVEALRGPVNKAVAAGIPVISMNSGDDAARELGVLTHVGQTEHKAGYGAGERMAAAGVKRALCVNQEQGNIGLDQRCQGFREAMAKAGATVKTIPVRATNPTETEQAVVAALAANPRVDGLLTLGPAGALPALKAVKKRATRADIKLATFDLTPEVLEAIGAGDMLFAIDQQQYLQGYLPIVFLALYKINLNTIPVDVLHTGPGYVTRENVAAILELTRKGTR